MVSSGSYSGIVSYSFYSETRQKKTNKICRPGDVFRNPVRIWTPLGLFQRGVCTLYVTCRTFETKAIFVCLYFEAYVIPFYLMVLSLTLSLVSLDFVICRKRHRSKRLMTHEVIHRAKSKRKLGKSFRHHT